VPVPALETISEVRTPSLDGADSGTAEEEYMLQMEGIREDSAEQGAHPVQSLCIRTAGEVGLPELLQRLPVAHSFWQYAEPVQGLNAQRSRAVHRLLTVSKHFAKVVSDSCASLSDPELVTEVIERWRRYELRVVLDIRSFNRRQAAGRTFVDPLEIVPFDSESEDDDS